MTTAVYCSASNRLDEEYLRLGDEVGKWLALNGDSLVFGGATGGLMTRVSEAFKRTDGHTGKLIGVVPKRIIVSGRKSEICDEMHIVENMSGRKQMMRDIADCFICLPGSYGTLDEMMDVIASGTVGEHSKPVIILNYKGFYNCLIAECEEMKRLHFLPEKEIYVPCFVNTLDELTKRLEELKI